jgi:isocitrate lyase
LNDGVFDLACRYAGNDMTAFVEAQEKEFKSAERSSS